MLPDQAERDLIGTEFDRLLFVEAGAGTGKTTVLVERIVSMVTGEGSFEPVPMSSIAAITFTDKAAAELRNRVRAELNKALQDTSGVQRDLVLSALSELDGAAVSTLHGFARRILAEHPVEAGLPPSFETLDEIASDVAFEERWDPFLSELMSDETVRWPVGMLDAAGVTPGHLRDLARALNANSDRLNWPAHLPPAALPGLTHVMRLASELLERRGECTNADECKLYASFAPISTLVERLSNTRNDRERLRVLMHSRVPKVRTKGSKRDWPDITAVRADFAELSEEIARSASSVVSEALAQVTERLRAFTVEGVAHRRRVGSLEFHDLLTQARWMLRDSPAAAAVRQALAQQYQRLLIDECQDTDPIQIELAELIAFPDGIGSVSAQPERLFFVGDPKQSIYRFRRADISLYMDAQRRLGEQLGSVISLQTNFRSLPGLSIGSTKSSPASSPRWRPTSPRTGLCRRDASFRAPLDLQQAARLQDRSTTKESAMACTVAVDLGSVSWDCARIRGTCRSPQCETPSPPMLRARSTRSCANAGWSSTPTHARSELPVAATSPSSSPSGRVCRSSLTHSPRPTSHSDWRQRHSSGKPRWCATSSCACGQYRTPPMHWQWPALCARPSTDAETTTSTSTGRSSTALGTTPIPTWTTRSTRRRSKRSGTCSHCTGALQAWGLLRSSTRSCGNDGCMSRWRSERGRATAGVRSGT